MCTMWAKTEHEARGRGGKLDVFPLQETASSDVILARILWGLSFLNLFFLFNKAKKSYFYIKKKLYKMYVKAIMENVWNGDFLQIETEI